MLITSVVISICTVLSFDRLKAIKALEQEQEAAVIEKTRVTATEFGYLSKEKPVAEEETIVLPPATEAYKFLPKGNDWIVVVNLKERLIYDTIEYYSLSRDGTLYIPKRDRGSVDPSLVSLLEKILHVRGVTEMWASPYSITVKKSEVHDWSAVARDIADVLDQSLPVQLPVPQTQPSQYVEPEVDEPALESAEQV